MENTIITMLLFLLSHCTNRQQTENEFADKLAATLTFAEKLIVDSIVAFELKALRNEYEYRGIEQIEPIPDYEQCSDLELVLILERILRFNTLGLSQYRYYPTYYYDPILNNIKGAAYLTMGNNMSIQRNLLTIAKEVRGYGFGSFSNSLELTIEDWLEFINALDKLGVNERKIKRKAALQ
jgi:hypothetical protein